MRNFHIWVPLGKFWGHKVKIKITAVQKRRRALPLGPDIVFDHHLVLSSLPLQQGPGGGKLLQPHRPSSRQLTNCNFSDYMQRSNPLTFWFNFYRWSRKRGKQGCGVELKAM